MQQIQEKSDSVSKSLDLSPSLQQNKNLTITRKVIDTSEFRKLNSKIKKDSAKRAQAKQPLKKTVPVIKSEPDTVILTEPRISVAIPEIPVKADVFLPGKDVFRKNNDWTFGIIVLALVIIASVRIISSAYLKQLFSATINFTTASRLFRERTFNLLHAAFRLDILFFMVLSLFACQALSFFGVSLFPKMPFLAYLVSMGALISYFMLKRFLYMFVATVTESQPETSEYLFNLNVYNRVLGIVLFPFILLLAFAPIGNMGPLLISGSFIIAVFWGLSLLRGAKILLRKHFSISYLILYLCTLEFLPLLVIVKIATG
ncbi:MAG: DUF4271 domain-containing protein [Prolixibacteraceae bacterium]|jgi:hypothetical protein|nr:DUF4271 domain-containing protein [Prolixibacteraceae bacterium]